MPAEPSISTAQSPAWRLSLKNSVCRSWKRRRSWPDAVEPTIRADLAVDYVAQLLYSGRNAHLLCTAGGRHVIGAFELSARPAGERLTLANDRDHLHAVRAGGG